MTDYLSRLVERSLGAASVVRPETASLFEPRDTAPQPVLAEVDVEASALAPVARSESPVAARNADEPVAGRVEQPRTASAAQEPVEAGRSPVEDVSAPALPLPHVEPGETDVPAVAEGTTAIVVRTESRERRSAAAAPALSVLPLVSPAPTPDEPPVVHVTIGRVDVRAVQSAQAPPSAAREREPEVPPRQTLSEYLSKGARP